MAKLLGDIYEAWLMDGEYRQRLSEAVRALRGDRSQRKFAKDLGVSFPAARSWEEGESLPGLENLERIADLRGESLEEFLLYLRGEEYSPPQRVQVAEDVMAMIDRLPRSEQIRLTQMMVVKISS